MKLNVDKEIIHRRNILVVSTLFIFYITSLAVSIAILGPSVLFPPVGLLLFSIIGYFIWKKKFITYTMYAVIIGFYVYFYYLLTDYPYIVNYFCMWFGLIISSLYQNIRAIITAWLGNILLTVYVFTNLREEIFPFIDPVDIVYFVIFATVIVAFFILQSRLTGILISLVEQNEQKLRHILGSARIVTYKHYISSGITKVFSRTDSFKDLPLEYQSNSPILWRQYVAEKDIAKIEKAERDLRNGKTVCQLEYELKLPYGQIMWISSRIIPVKSPFKVVERFEGVVTDVTEQKKAQEEMEFLAFHDYLTGLPNRPHLSRYFNSLIESLKDKNHSIYLLYIDLDSFKKVNDQYGHAVGDQLLKIVGNRLNNAIREKDIVARVGGDEFVIIVEGEDQDTIISVADRIVNTLTSTFTLGEITIKLTLSIGISKYDGEEDDLESMMTRADKAMYSVKKEGKNAFKLVTGDKMSVT